MSNGKSKPALGRPLSSVATAHREKAPTLLSVSHDLARKLAERDELTANNEALEGEINALVTRGDELLLQICKAKAETLSVLLHSNLCMRHGIIREEFGRFMKQRCADVHHTIAPSIPAAGLSMRKRVDSIPLELEELLAECAVLDEVPDPPVITARRKSIASMTPHTKRKVMEKHSLVVTPPPDTNLVHKRSSSAPGKTSLESKLFG